MSTSDSCAFEKHPFCLTICIFNFNIQQNKQNPANISANEGKTDDIHDGYHCLPVSANLSSSLIITPLYITFFPSMTFITFQVPT